jgi:hypothetical protein
VASVESIGTPLLASSISPSSVATSEAIGQPAIGFTIYPNPISSTEVIGLPIVKAVGMVQVSEFIHGNVSINPTVRAIVRATGTVYSGVNTKPTTSSVARVNITTLP